MRCRVHLNNEEYGDDWLKSDPPGKWGGERELGGGESELIGAKEAKANKKQKWENLTKENQ